MVDDVDRSGTGTHPERVRSRGPRSGLSAWVYRIAWSLAFVALPLPVFTGLHLLARCSPTSSPREAVLRNRTGNPLRVLPALRRRDGSLQRLPVYDARVFPALFQAPFPLRAGRQMSFEYEDEDGRDLIWIVQGEDGPPRTLTVDLEDWHVPTVDALDALPAATGVERTCFEADAFQRKEALFAYGALVWMFLFLVARMSRPRVLPAPPPEG
ncbi:MAG: hypothetical protein R3F30_15710 [Planctomycetota bacterium]